MARVKIKHPRPKHDGSRIELVSILGTSGIYVTRIITVDDGFIVLTKDDKDTDTLFQRETIVKLNEKQFSPTVPVDIKAKKTILCFNVDSFIYENHEDDIKREIMAKNQWCEENIEQVIKFPNKNIIKIIYTQTQLAVKATQSGIVAFNISIPPQQIKQEKFVPILTCMKCYKIDDHTTKNCNENNNYIICSECSEEGHTWKECRSENKKCINCGGKHRTTAMKCPKRREAVNNKRKELEEGANTQPARSFSEVTKDRPLIDTKVRIEDGVTAKIMTCLLLAHQMNMAEPGSFGKQLNELLSKNNLPQVTVPSNPPSRKIFNAMIGEDKHDGEGNSTQHTESDRTCSERDWTGKNYNTVIPSPNSTKDGDKQPTLVHKISGTTIGLQIITTESRGWPREGFNVDTLIDGLQRRQYKWTYTNNELEEEEVFEKLSRNEIDLKNCWIKVHDSTFGKIRSGHLRDRSPLQCRDPRRKRANHNSTNDPHDTCSPNTHG